MMWACSRAGTSGRLPKRRDARRAGTRFARYGRDEFERQAMARFENCLQCGKRLSGTTIFCAPCMACLCSWECREQHVHDHAQGKIIVGNVGRHEAEQGAGADSRH